MQYRNVSGHQDLPLPLLLGHYDKSTFVFSPGNEPGTASSFKTWKIQLAIVSMFSSLLLIRYLSVSWALKSSSTPKCQDPPQVPYFMPVVGNLVSYLFDAAKLASSITCVAPFLPHFLLLQEFMIGANRQAAKILVLRPLCA